MTDAELIALASLVNASCTEIAAANQVRHRNGQAPAYNAYVDLYGGDAMEQIHEELTRRRGDAPKAAPAVCDQCKSKPIGLGIFRCRGCEMALCLTCASAHPNTCTRPL